MTGYTRQALANIADGLTIFSADINAEFNQLQTAFNGTTGHVHDGNTGNAPKIALGTSISGFLPVVNGGTGGINNLTATTAPTVNADNTQNYVVGSIWVDTTNGIFYVCISAATNAAVWQRHQVYSTDLTAMAALTSAANTMYYATGAGTWATATLSPFIRTLLPAADAATARTTLGLTIGTNIQAQNANLTALGGVTSAVDTLPYFNGLSSATTTTLTASGRALISGASAGAQLTTLGASAYIQTLLPAVDAPTARTTLGVDASGVNQPLNSNLTALAGLNVTGGIVVQTAANTFTKRTLTGTANEITVTNGDGVAGTPTVSLPAALTFTGKTITGGTHTSGTWSSGAITTSSATISGGSITGLSSAIPVASGGTGVTTLTGIVKASGTSAFTAATAGTDYYNPGGTKIAVADGGTNIGAYTVGDILYASGATTLSKLGVGTAGQVLSQNAGLTAPQWATLPFTKSFESAQQTVTYGGLLTLAHGLGVQPKLYMAYLVNTVTDNGYTPGMEVPVTNMQGGTNAFGPTAIVPDSTNINVRFASSAIYLNNFSNGGNFLITTTSWKLIVRAWA